MSSRPSQTLLTGVSDDCPLTSLIHPGLELALLHIPKTGGSARRTSLGAEAGPRVLWDEHRLRLADVPGHLPAICYLRDPISRFESGYSVVAPGRLPPIDELAQDPSVITDPGLELIFRPQVWWLNVEAPLDRARLRTLERMTHSWPELMRQYEINAAPLPTRSDPGYNAWDRKPNRKRPRLSAQGRLDVLRYYHDDAVMWSELVD